MGIKINQLPLASNMDVSGDYFAITKDNETKKINLENLLNTVLVSREEYNNAIEKLNKMTEEMFAARNTYYNLNTRLEKDNEEIYETLNKDKFHNFTGTNINIDNSKIGFTRNMKLKGRTLQNIFPIKTNSLFLQNATYSQSKKIATFLPSLNNYCNFWDMKDHKYKPNTIYTFVLNIIENTLVPSSINNAPVIIIGGDVHSVIEQSCVINVLNITGIKKVTFQTKNDINSITDNQGIRIFLNNNVQGGNLSFQVMVLEGDWTNKEVPSYFEGIKSVGEAEGNKISILSCGKNLFDINKGIKNIINGNLTIEKKDSILKLKGSGSYCAYNFNFNLKPNISYTLKRKVKINTGSGESGRILIFEDGINTHTLLSNEPIIFIPKKSNVQLSLIGNWGTNSEFDIDFFELQLEEGTQATSYEPYKEYKREIQLNQPFAGLKGVQDTIEETEQGVIYTQNIGIEKLNDGSFEGWYLREDVTNDTYITYQKNFPQGKGDAKTGDFLCNVLPNKTFWNTFEKGCWFDCNLFITLKKSELISPDWEGFKNFLVTKSPIAYYIKAQSETYLLPSIPSTNIKTMDKKTYICSNNTIGSELSFEAPQEIIQ